MLKELEGLEMDIYILLTNEINLLYIKCDFSHLTNYNGSNKCANKIKGHDNLCP